VCAIKAESSTICITRPVCQKHQLVSLVEGTWVPTELRRWIAFPPHYIWRVCLTTFLSVVSKHMQSSSKIVRVQCSLMDCLVCNHGINFWSGCDMFFTTEGCDSAKEFYRINKFLSLCWRNRGRWMTCLQSNVSGNGFERLRRPATGRLLKCKG